MTDGGWTDKRTDGRKDKADASKNNNYVDSFADDVDDDDDNDNDNDDDEVYDDDDVDVDVEVEVEVEMTIWPLFH